MSWMADIFRVIVTIMWPKRTNYGVWNTTSNRFTV